MRLTTLKVEVANPADFSRRELPPPPMVLAGMPAAIKPAAGPASRISDG